MKFINIRLKTIQEIDEMYPDWDTYDKRKDYKFNTPIYNIGVSFRSLLGKDITHEFDSFFESEELFPLEFELFNRNLSKEFLVITSNQSVGYISLCNGLHKNFIKNIKVKL